MSVAVIEIFTLIFTKSSSGSCWQKNVEKQAALEKVEVQVGEKVEKVEVQVGEKGEVQVGGHSANRWSSVWIGEYVCLPQASNRTIIRRYAFLHPPHRHNHCCRRHVYRAQFVLHTYIH